MSGNGNSPAKFPAGRALVSFGAGCCVTGACMAGLAALMAQQGLSQDAAWPMATCAVSAGSLFSGWLMAFWQKSRGLFCGVVQGALFVFLLLCFGLLSAPYNIAAMFLNGLSLGCMWGVIFSFIEGRRMTDILASLLGVSMVISSGTAKSAGLYVMNNLHVNEFWMPALIGAVALPLLALLGYALNRLPQPTEEDIAMKSERATLNGKQRWELFKNFMPFLMMLFVANIAIVVLRDIKEDFLVNIIDVSEYSPWLFAKIDSVVTLIILVVFGLMVFVKDNLKALSILFGLIIMGMIVMSVVSFGQERFQLSPVVWLFVQSLCLYIAYLTFQTIFFDRFIACFKIHGNVGFFIVTTDFLGYTGTVLVLVLKEFCNPHIDWAVFYNQFAGYVGIFCCITFICSFVYLHQRFRKENGLAVKSNEVLELDTASRNAITMA